MAVRLTETAIARAARAAAEAGRRGDLSDATLPGVRLRLTPTGGKSWVLACRDPLGRFRRFPLGEYPAMGIAEAREAARALRAEVRKGADPVAEAKRRRAIGREARDGIGTLAALLDLYAKQKGAALKSWPECRRRIEVVFAPFLSAPLATMEASDLQMQADGWASKQSAAAAVRYLRPMLKWAAHRGYVVAEATALHPPATVGRRKRTLSRDELARLLPALAASGRPYAAALRFMLLTLARREEVCTARWRDVDLTAAAWTIPDTKNGETHIVPLSSQAMELLDAIRPVSAVPHALVFHTATGNRLMNWDRETKAIMETSGTAGWTRHDLRRTGATMLGEMGEPPHVIEAALNHVAIASQIAATYNRSRYRPEVRAALQRLADALDAIAEGGGELVPLRRA